MIIKQFINCQSFYYLPAVPSYSKFTTAKIACQRDNIFWKERSDMLILVNNAEKCLRKC